jgi:hypothetical protein
LIDTPGFGDTRGIDFDENIGKCLKEFFSNDTYPINELSSIGLVIQVSISPTVYAQLFGMEMFCAALQFYSLIFFCQKNINTKAACKMLVKLTTGKSVEADC